MADGKIKLPRSSYEEIIKIVRAYARQDKAVLLSEISKTTGMNEAVISANVSFLSNISLIDGGKAKKATSLGVELGRALEHGMLSEITRTWETIVKTNDFLSKMVAAVSIRNGMETSSLEAHIAYSAGEPKAKHVTTGAKAVIEILKSSELVFQEGDRILPFKKEKQNISVQQNDMEKSTKPLIESSERIPQIENTIYSNYAGVNINIEIKVQVNVNELDNLGEKIVKVLQDVDKYNKVNSKE